MTGNNHDSGADLDASAFGYPRTDGESDYSYWQWVLAEEDFELESAEEEGAGVEVIAEIQARIDLHVAQFRAASERE